MNKSHVKQIHRAATLAGHTVALGQVYELVASYFGFRTYAAMASGTVTPSLPGSPGERVRRSTIFMGIDPAAGEIVLAKLNDLATIRSAGK